MARPARANHRELLVLEVAKQLLAKKEIHVANACREIGIAPSLANHYFQDKDELAREAWLSIMLAFVTEDFEQLDHFGQQDDWEGVRAFIFEVFSPRRLPVRQAHIRGLGVAMLDSELGGQVEQIQRETTERWHALLKTYADKGILKPKVDLWSLALLFTAIPIGVTAVQGELTQAERASITDTWLTMLRAVL